MCSAGDGDGSSRMRLIVSSETERLGRLANREQRR